MLNLLKLRKVIKIMIKSQTGYHRESDKRFWDKRQRERERERGRERVAEEREQGERFEAHCGSLLFLPLTSRHSFPFSFFH